jgi:hypothetical protein
VPQDLLSCLYGSERGVNLSGVNLSLLSCLYGSEQLYQIVKELIHLTIIVKS